LAYKTPQKIYRILRRYDNFYHTLSQEAPDIIFIHCLSFADASIVVKYLKEHPEVRVFGDNHTDYINSARNWLSMNILHKIVWRHYARKLEPYLIKCYGVTPLRCHFLTEVYKISPDIVEFLPMGVDDDAIPEDRNKVRKTIREELGVADDAFLIMTGGKIDVRKNTHILLEAIKRINNPKLYLVICGVLAPEMEYIKEQFDSNVHYLGWCNAQRVMDCMVAADLACFPGTHSTLWEQAVGVGLPAIFKHWNEMNHMNVNDNCIFVEGENIEELTQRIAQMLDLDNDFYNQQMQNAKAAAPFFCYSEIAKKAIGL
jgi:glycosyltransferase involved in cell wall biosynthesis